MKTLKPVEAVSALYYDEDKVVTLNELITQDRQEAHEVIVEALKAKKSRLTFLTDQMLIEEVIDLIRDIYQPK